VGIQIRQTIGYRAFMSNCFIVFCDEKHEGIIVDPGPRKNYNDVLEAEGVTLKAAALTHGHLDHVLGAAEARREFSIPLAMHADDEFLLKAVIKSTSAYALPEIEVPEVDRWLEHGDKIEFGNCALEVIHTPGHTQGCICLYSPGHLITGDTIFQASIGRTDLPGGDYEQIIDSIKKRILTLPKETVIYSGHGPETTVGIETDSNPFLQ
jgi:hydroxyacylglutathione hydrolase